MTLVNILVNGRPVAAQAGSTVLRAAQEAGIDIPTLCDHPALEPIGACRVCLVEIKGQRVLQPACTFPVTEGMEVQTESQPVVQARRFVLDLLFSERNHYCMFCEMSGDCELQDLGYRYGLDHWVYPTYMRSFPVDATRQFFMMDHNRCILCRRCVRACAELVANHTLGLKARGAKTMICADMDVPFAESSCVSCGTCLQVCPTGALVDKRSAFMGRCVQTEHIRSTCSQCSVGCGTQVITRGGVLRVEGDWAASPNGGLLCQKGRFDLLAEGRTRLTRPMVRRNGTLEDTDWNTALEAASRKLGSMPREKIGVLASSNCTNEALYLLGGVLGQEMGAPNLALLNGVLPALLTPQGSFRDLSEADVILVVGADPVADQPVASFLIKRRVDAGAHLVVVNGHDTGLSSFAHSALPMEQIGAAVELARRAQRPVVLYGTGMTVEAASSLQALDCAVFIGLEPGVNTRAAVAFGLNGRFVPGEVEAALVLAGEQELGEGQARVARGTHVVAVASYESALTQRADVVLPMAIWSERSGSLTNCEGAVLQVNRVVDPVGEAKADWQILALLAEKLGKPVPSGLLQLTTLATQQLSR